MRHLLCLGLALLASAATAAPAPFVKTPPTGSQSTAALRQQLEQRGVVVHRVDPTGPGACVVVLEFILEDGQPRQESRAVAADTEREAIAQLLRDGLDGDRLRTEIRQQQVIYRHLWRKR